MLKKSSEDCLRLGLHGSLIPVAPLAFVHQRQKSPRCSPSPLVFHSISTDFTPTLSVPASPETLYSISLFGFSKVKLWALTKNLIKRLRNSLRPINPDNACTLRITEASGT